MICGDCKEAGKYKDTDPDMARGLHGRCKGGTWCDCQHVAGQALLAPAGERLREVAA